jgi:hypothetical protein
MASRTQRPTPGERLVSASILMLGSIVHRLGGVLRRKRSRGSESALAAERIPPPTPPSESSPVGEAEAVARSMNH